MDALRLFWFFEPRMALWGLGLGTFLGVMYGLFVGVFLPPLGLLFGPLLGSGYGAIAGLALGIMEGAVLWAFTLLFHRRSKSGDTSQYLRRAGYVCAGACVLAPALFFEFVARWSGTSLVTGAYDSSDVIMLLIFLLIPTLIAACAVRWTVTRMAEQYIRDFGEQENHSPEQVSHKSPTETRRNQ
jgi:hypothetical protein